MATVPRLVNKQFNTPIGLYSQHNIQETLNKQTQVLNNGAIGIDFNNPVTSKPSNLANSAVLRMLEEEEQRQRSGQPGRYSRGDKTQDPYIRRIDRMIDWPPKASTTSGQISMNNTYSAKFFTPNTSGLKRVAWPPPAEETNGEAVDRQTPPQRQAAPVPAPAKLHQSPALSRLIPFDTEPVSHNAPQSQVYSPQPSISPPQLKPFNTQSQQKIASPLSPQPKPLSPQPTTPTQTFPPPVPQFATFPRKNQSSFVPVSSKPFAPVAPQPFETKPFAPQPFEPKTFTPVTSQLYNPVPPPQDLFQTFPPPSLSPIPPLSQREIDLLSPQPYSPVTSQPLTFHSKGLQGSGAQPGAWTAPAKVATLQDQFVEPPPTTVTLRQTAPVHQKPAPVVASQPVTHSFKVDENDFAGGVNMRGDQKWPPQSVKDAVTAENEARIMLAKGPACRPRKVRKDYGAFFAKNALPNNYPGYRVPPGTQHYDDQTGSSQF